MIPKVIHTCWFSKDPNYELSDKVKNCIDSWKKNCPDYEIKVWSISDWSFQDFPYAKQCWEAGVASYAYLSNFFRFWVLYNHGGWYIESDMLLNKGLDEFESETVVLGEINPGEISGALMGSIKGHSLFKHFISVYSRMSWIKKDHSLELYHDSGFNGDEIRKAGYDFPKNIKEKTVIGDVSFFPKNYFFPKWYNNKSVSVHIGSLTHYRKISIVMPVWNSEKYLKECIDSILSQDLNDFELLCIDDGSTDSSPDIIKSYKDDRVVYIHKTHSGIVDSLNIGIRRAIGIYIVRMDSDDIMLPGRLKHQYQYMEDHKEIDILGSGFQWGNGKSVPEFWRCPEMKLQIKDFYHGNRISHPTTIFRRNRILTLPYIYENYFQGCEDYRLWHHALHHGLVIATEPTPVIIYRQHEKQETSKKDYFEKINPLLNQVKRTYSSLRSDENLLPELTCIIPFQNEGSEVERTVANIRGTAGNEVDIILINDTSNDNYNYKWIADHYNCTYYENSKNLGVAGSRNLGVANCNTKYFVLLDAHMRFYDEGWHTRLLKVLKENPECIISSNTIVFSYDKETKLYTNEDCTDGRYKFGSFGALVNMGDPGWEFTAKWTSKIMNGYEDKDLIPISCCLGAVYATSKDYWMKLGGLSGLIKYGLDEPLISIKAWLSGGKVLLMKNWGVGHLYRGASPYSVPLRYIDQNQIYLINLFSKNREEVEKYEKNLENRLGTKRFETALNDFRSQYDSFMEFKNYFFSKVAIYDMEWFIKNINNNLK